MYTTKKSEGRAIKMTTDNILNNEVELTGTVESDLKFNHEVYGEGFYSFVIRVMRLSDISDLINVTVSERLLQNFSLSKGDLITVNGQFRSYNNYTENGNKLMLTVFARDISINPEEGKLKNPNSIFLNGFLCKKPVYRTTPFGREITDLLIAVNRAYNKSDYIPCIAWVNTAHIVSQMEVPTCLKVIGRIQSREYNKVLNDTTSITKTAYEVSISKLINE